MPDTVPVTYETRDGVAHVTLDDGKANVLSPAVVAALDGCLTRAEDDGAQAFAVIGRPGMLSGGFDLKVMMSSPQAAGELVTAGGALFARLYASPLPVVVGCTGHAVAAGALLLLAADERVGAAGEFRIGLIETAKGMVLPRWAVELAHERLAVQHRQAATVGARMYDPAGAAAAGFLDAVVDAGALGDEVAAAARRWGDLPRAAYAGQVRANRAACLDRLDAALAADRGTTFGLAGGR